MNNPEYKGIYPVDEDLGIEGHLPGSIVKQYDHPLIRRYEEFEAHLHAMHFASKACDALADLVIKRANASPIPEYTEAIEITLWEGIVIGYARSFDKGFGVKLRPEEYLNGEMLAKHNDVCALRNKHVGHDINNFRSVKSGVDIAADGTVLGVSTIYVTTTPGLPALRIVRELIEMATQHINEQRRHISAAILADARKVGSDALLALPILQHPAQTLGFTETRDRERETGQKKQKPKKKSPGQ